MIIIISTITLVITMAVIKIFIIKTKSMIHQQFTMIITGIISLVIVKVVKTIFITIVIIVYL